MHPHPGDDGIPGRPSHDGIEEVDKPKALLPASARPYYMALWQRHGQPPPAQLPRMAVDNRRYRYERVPGE